MPKPALIILDCDGVLVDSERITTALLAEVATELGWPVSAADAVASFKGRDLHEVQVLIEARTGQPVGDSFITDYRERMAVQFTEHGVPPIDGAAELLDWLDENDIAHAIASNGPQEKMQLTLGRIGVRSGAGPFQAPGRGLESPPPCGGGAGSLESDTADWFARFEGRRFSAYDIQVWKPEPDLFLHAAKEMGAAPEACVVVEDSTSGITAAVAAGMRVIGFADLTPAAHLEAAGATAVCTSIEDVTTLIGSWSD